MPTFQCRVSSIDNLERINVSELWLNIPGLQGNVGEAEQAVGHRKLIDDVTKESVVFVGDLFEKGNIRPVSLSL